MNRAKVKSLEAELAKELKELKQAHEQGDWLSENLPTAVPTSLGMSLNESFYSKQREMELQQICSIEQARPLKNEADLLSESLRTAVATEHTAESTIALVYKYFCDQVDELKWAKYLHMLRYVRFCTRAKTLKQHRDLYDATLARIQRQYVDAEERADRLRSAVEVTPPNQSLIQAEDLRIYMRSIITELKEVGDISTFCDTYRWAVVRHRSQIFEEMKARCSGPTVKPSQLQLPQTCVSLVPLKSRLNKLLGLFGSSQTANQIETEADELEMLHEAKAIFMKVFQEQCQMLDTKPYREAEPDGDSKEALDARRPSRRGTLYVKKALWLHAQSIFEERDAQQQTRSAVLARYAGAGLDAMLKSESDFVVQGDLEYTILQLKQRSEVLQKSERDLETMSLAVASHPQGDIHTAKLWGQVYKREDDAGKSGEGVRGKQDEKKGNGTGALQSFMILRLLQIRSSQQKCRGILNYFRSIQRSLTLDLAATSNATDRHSKEHAGFDADLNNISTSVGISNHDDYYSEGHDGNLIVKDAAGVNILYDVTQEDFSKLDSELLCLGTHYVQRQARTNEKPVKKKMGSNLRRWGSDESIASVASHASRASRTSHVSHSSRISAVSRAAAASAGGSSNNDPEHTDFDMDAYIQHGVDRSQILLDLWICEEEYQNAKVKLIELYYTAYLHVFNLKDRQRLAQVIQNINYRRPHFDLESEYFVAAYKTDTAVLHRMAELVTNITNHIKSLHRKLVDQNKLDGDSESFGTRLPLVKQGPIKLHSSVQCDSITTDIDPAKVYLFEHIPSMVLLVDVYDSIKHNTMNANRLLQPQGATDSLYMNLCLIDIAHRCWAEVCIDSPNSLNLAPSVSALWDCPHLTSMKSLITISDRVAEQQERKKAPSDSQDDSLPTITFGKPSLEVYITTLEIVLVRHRLLRAVRETIELNKTYIQECNALGLDDGLAYMRPVLFARLSNFSGGEQDSYVPSKVGFAASEILEESPELLLSDIDEISTAIEGSINSVATNAQCGEGVLGTLRGLLESQIAVRNALSVAVDYREVCNDPSGAEAERIIIALRNELNAEPDSNPVEIVQKHTSFLSLQSVKTKARSIMCEAYTKRKGGASSGLQEEMLRLYCKQLNHLIGRNAMRLQMARYAASMKHLLDYFPSTRDYYFQLGELNQVTAAKRLENAAMEATMDRGSIAMSTGILKNKSNAEQEAFEAERQERSPLELLTSDGKRIRNPWYIPYELEFCTMYNKLEDDEQDKSLRVCLGLIFAVHDILMILCAHAKVGSSHARLGTMDSAFVGVGADWGGTEGIGAELRQLRRNIGRLQDPSDPSLVCEYLDNRRQIIHLEWVLTVQYYVRETFLAKSNEDAYKIVTANTRTGLKRMSRSIKPRFLGYIRIGDGVSGNRRLLPFRSSIGNQGPFRRAFLFENIGASLELCLTNLNEVERHIANGEVLGISLLMEDILEQKRKKLDLHSKSDDDRGIQLVEETPLDSAKHSHSFLVTSTILEKLKYQWCENILGIRIDSEPRYRAFSRAYDTQIVAPVVRHLLGQGGLSSDDNDDSGRRQQRSTAGLLVGHGTALQLHGIPELTYRVKLVEELKQHLECSLIHATRNLVRQKLMAISSEVDQSSGQLSSDAWAMNSTKKGQNAHSAVPVPAAELVACTIAQDFCSKLYCKSNVSEGTISIPKKDLTNLLGELAIAINTREQKAYLAYSDRHRAIEGQYHHRLTVAEDEMEAKIFELNEQNSTFEHRLECEIGDRIRHVIGEITALRAKVSRLHAELETQENVVRERVKRDYDDLVHSLFSTSFALKNRFEEYRSQLYEDVVVAIGDVRKAAINRMKMVSYGKTEEALAKYKTMHSTADNLRDTQSENAMLSGLVLKMRTMNDWKRTGVRSFYGKKIWQANQHAAAYKKAFFQVKLMAQDLEAQASREITALRRQLGAAKADKSSLKQTLQDERQRRVALQQWKAQKMQMLLQVEDKAAIFERIKHLDIEQALHDLATFDDRMQAIRNDAADAIRAKELAEKKLKNEIRMLRQRLAEETRIKQSAVMKLDDESSGLSTWNTRDVGSLIDAMNKDYSNEERNSLPKRRSRPASARPAGSPRRSSVASRRPNSARTLSRPSSASVIKSPSEVLDESVELIRNYKMETRGGWIQ